MAPAKTTTIHTEGLGQGYDLEMVEKVADSVDIPVVACGGLGTTDHLRELIQTTRASAAASAQALHWRKLELADLRATVADEGCFVRLSDPRRFSQQGTFVTTSKYYKGSGLRHEKYKLYCCGL